MVIECINPNERKRLVLLTRSRKRRAQDESKILFRNKETTLARPSKHVE